MPQNSDTTEFGSAEIYSLADVAMPHINGYELSQLVKNGANPRFVLTPLILMSGRTLDSDIRYAKSLGADDYLPKPLEVHLGKVLCIKNVRSRGYLLVANIYSTNNDQEHSI